VNLLIGAATIGLILAPLALGIFISYRIFQVLDLTADGSFGVGAATAGALLVRHVPALLATGLGIVAGAIAGGLTGVLYTKFKVRPLLAGVLTSTALYSVNLFIMGSGNLSLAGTDSLASLADRLGGALFPLAPESALSAGALATLLLMAVLAALLALGLALFLSTDLGLALRAAGNNAQMARAVGIDVDLMVVLGLGLANGLIGLSGALLAQYDGFANIQMGIGTVVTGVAMLMVGETLFGRRNLGRWIASAVLGAVAFRLLIAGAVWAGLNPDALKLVTALFVLAVLILPEVIRRARARSAASRIYA
jgi:putative tryptophan/tyrosine transport system permease protein